MDLWPVHAMRLLMPDVPPEPDAKAARLQRVTERGLVTFRLDSFQVVPSSLNKTVGIYTNKVSFEHIGSCGYCVAVTALLVWSLESRDLPGTFKLEFPNHPESENTAFRGERPIRRAFLWEIKNSRNFC